MPEAISGRSVIPGAARPDVAGAPVWLFSARVDLATFLGSALASLLLLWIGAELGVLHGDAPQWTWVTAVLLVDVAHVYATGFRVYFDPRELGRRPWLYALAPALGFLLGLALYSESETLFWRCLAYLAVFHFVRQQYGWVALYRAKACERGAVGRAVDAAAIYLATLYPLIYWHAHLPRAFWWFLPGDFASVPAACEAIAAPLYAAAMAAYAARSVYRGFVLRCWNPGKDIVVVTTAVCWYVGIVAISSDFAFTVTTVIIHGVPYLVLVYHYRLGSTMRAAGPRRQSWQRIPMFLAAVWALAYVEELLWDRGVWHERSWLFGSDWDLGRWQVVVVPLLAVPQVTHYVLDGFIWRRRSNPALDAMTSPASVRYGSR